MLSLPANTDPVYIAPEHYSAMDRFFLRLINDKRDLPFIHLIFKVSFSIVPLGRVVVRAGHKRLALAVDRCRLPLRQQRHL
jgi:hypothetical protein